MSNASADGSRLAQSSTAMRAASSAWRTWNNTSLVEKCERNKESYKRLDKLLIRSKWLVLSAATNGTVGLRVVTTATTTYLWELGFEGRKCSCCGNQHHKQMDWTHLPAEWSLFVKLFSSRLHFFYNYMMRPVHRKYKEWWKWYMYKKKLFFSMLILYTLVSCVCEWKGWG